MLSKLVLVCLALTVVVATRKRYDGYKILKVTPTTEKHVQLLRTMEAQGHLEILKGVALGLPGQVLIGPASVDSVRMRLLTNNVRVYVQVDNVQIDIDREQQRLDVRRDANPYSFDINDFNNLEAINSQLDKWVGACPTGLTCTLTSIGQSFEGRDQRVLKVGKTGANNNGIWFESVIHAREWLSVATSLKFIDHIINNYGSDAEVKTLVDNHDWYFLVVANPDGYHFTWTDDRMWRRNRRPQAVCIGADLNRNFDIYHGKEGSGTFCQDTYPGPYPHSEPETDNIAKYAAKLTADQKFDTWMAVHAFGKMFMCPYGNTIDNAGRTCEIPDDYADLMRVANAAVDAMETTAGEPGSWRKGTICNVIYPATGDEVNYMYVKHKVKYTWAIELRGDYFIVNKSEIGKSFKELWSGVKAMIEEIAIMNPAS